MSNQPTWLVSQGGLAHRCGNLRSRWLRFASWDVASAIRFSSCFFVCLGVLSGHITLAGCTDTVCKQLHAPAVRLPLGHLSWPGKRGCEAPILWGGQAFGVFCVWWPHGSFAGRVCRCACACCQNCVPAARMMRALKGGRCTRTSPPFDARYGVACFDVCRSGGDVGVGVWCGRGGLCGWQKWMQFLVVNALSRQCWAGCMLDTLSGCCCRYLSAVVQGTAQGGEHSGCKQPETRGFS